ARARVPARPLRHDLLTTLAVIRARKAQRRDFQILDRVELPMPVVHTVIVSHPGVIAADNDVRASEVLSNDGVKHCLARTCVAHLTVEPTEQRSLRWIIALEESFVRFELCPLREVSRLLPADDRVHEQSVYKRQRQLLEVLVRAVRHVARVERRHRVPAALGEQLAGLARPVEVLTVLDLWLTAHR